MTAELLTVRLNSVNEIISLQEEKMVEKVRVLTSCFLKVFYFLFTSNDDAAASHNMV